MSDFFFILVNLALIIYFACQWKRKETKKGFHGFATGVFLIIFIVKVARYSSHFFQ